MNSLTRLVGALIYRERMRWHYYSVSLDTWLAVKARVSHGMRHTIFRWQFWLGMTMGFPLEHWLWEKVLVHVFPFSLIMQALGLN